MKEPIFFSKNREIPDLIVYAGIVVVVGYAIYKGREVSIESPFVKVHIGRK